MEIISVASSKYSKSDNSTIDCMVKFDDGRTLPYTAAASDNENHGKQLWQDLIAGKYGAIIPYSET